MSSVPHSKKLAIAATAFNRPQLLAQMLRSVAHARGCQDWDVYISVDPSSELPENLSILTAYEQQLRLRYVVNDANKGIRRNPFDVVQAAFLAGAEAVLLLEDDLTISSDALEYCVLLLEGSLRDQNVLCANLLMTTCMSESIYDPVLEADCRELSPLVVMTRFFSSYGLIVTKAQWHKHFVPNWFNDEPRMEDWHGGRAVGWDVSMNRALLEDPKLWVLQSMLPRVNHHGAHGTHVGVDFQARSFGNVRIDRCELPALGSLTVIDPLLDLARVPSANARLYLNLCRHLWDLQGSTLRFKHRASDFIGKKARKFRIFSREFLIFKRRV